MNKQFSFSDALIYLKAGGRVARAGWNGKNMSLYLMTLGGFEPCVVMITATGHLQPGWLCSQADMLADDWMQVK